MWLMSMIQKTLLQASEHLDHLLSVLQALAAEYLVQNEGGVVFLSRDSIGQNRIILNKYAPSYGNRCG
jgi:hypothetical protein